MNTVPAAARRPQTTSRTLSRVRWPPKADLFGLGISVTTYDEAVECVVEAGVRRQAAVVSCQAVHAVVTASRSEAARRHANDFQMIVPDGQPVRWALNLLHGAGLRDRVYGPELMLRVCARAAERAVPVYLYGSTPEVLERLVARLGNRFPRLHVAGVESPPFRALTREEGRAMVRRVAASGAGIVFVGLGCPRQDEFAQAYGPAIDRVLVCVGAAFDFHAGTKRMAPRWMQRRGLEWAFRLSQEPRRLWRRYLVTNSLFLARLILAVLRARIFRPRQDLNRSEMSWTRDR